MFNFAMYLSVLTHFTTSHMKKSLLLTAVAVAAVIPSWAESPSSGIPTMSGVSITRCTSVSDFQPGNKYIVRAHNILWDNDKFLVVNGTSASFKTWSEIADGTAAIFELKTASTTLATKTFTNLTFTESSTDAFYLQHGDRIISMKESAMPTTSGTSTDFKVYKTTTLPASPTGLTTASCVHEEETDNDGFFLFGADICYLHHATGTIGLFSSNALYYNLRNLSNGTSLNANLFKTKYLDPFFIVYKVEYTLSEEIVAKYEECHGKWSGVAVGNNPGQYLASYELETKWQAVESAYATPETIDESAFTTAAEAFLSAYNAATQNPIPTNGYIRIKNYSNGYLTMPASGNNTTKAEADASTIFFHNSQSNLINYKEGCAVAVAGNIINGRSTAEKNNEAALDTAGYKFTFVNHPAWAEYDIKTDRFMIRYNGQTAFGGATVGANLDHAAGTWTDMASTDAATNGQSRHYIFSVENVTELPITIHADGFGSVIAPVALVAPEGATTYTVTIDGTKVTFTEVETGATIPAGTHAYFAATEGTLNVAISNETTDNAAAGHTSLVGSHMLTQITAEEGMNYYAKTVVPASAANIRPMMMNTQQGAPSISLVKLTPADGKVTLPPGTSVIKIPASASDSAVLSINPANGYDTTGITNIGQNNISNAVYDLQGRRLANPTRGLNIIGGRLIRK